VIFVKADVRPKSLTLMAAAANVAETLGVPLTVTSGEDGQHMSGSRHYTGDAIDIRRRNLSKPQLDAVLAGLKERLGPGYDIVLERTHIHVEYDPR
jgi:hypothetical protein